ncbi:hypothetical protein K5X82_01375 [Halosquirtibacter xylanolyticus]|uniref:hypothetical protein n=1 Tax=Halosquirtibacter xylanolyticus TaxID=3374599 RepID=UPI003748DB6E|nr:hypothetical protein K5X82_01375 [Prolixibacteraceae bacterium]
MKKILVIYLTIFAMISCNDDDNGENEIGTPVNVNLSFRTDQSLGLSLKSTKATESESTITYEYETSGYTLRVYGDMIAEDIFIEDIDLTEEEITFQVIQNSTLTFYVDIYHPDVNTTPTEATDKAHYGLTSYRCDYTLQNPSILIPMELIQGANTVTHQGDVSNLTDKVYLYDQEVEYNQTLYIKDTKYQNYDVIAAAITTTYGETVAMASDVLPGQSVVFIVRTSDGKLQFQLPEYGETIEGSPIPPGSSTITGKGTFNLQILDIVAGNSVVSNHNENGYFSVFVKEEDIPESKSISQIDMDINAETLYGQDELYVEIYLKNEGGINSLNDQLTYYISGANAGKYESEAYPKTYYTMSTLPVTFKNAKPTVFEKDGFNGNFFMISGNSNSNDKRVVAIQTFNIE